MISHFLSMVNDWLCWNCLCNYLNQEDVFVFGEFNSRTQSLPDFIEKDYVHKSLDSLFRYTADHDSKLAVRMNPDTGHNEYSTKLLSSCKTTGLRIWYGWHKGGHANHFSLNGSSGLNTINYLLAPVHMFDSFDKSIVCNFNAVPGHETLLIELHISLNKDPCQKPVDSHEYSQRKRSSWKMELLETCINSIILKQHKLTDCINIKYI